MQSATTPEASIDSSRPIITPLIRMSRIRPGISARHRSKCDRNRSPTALPRSRRPSASIVSIAASPARQAIGLPPKVLACIPGLSAAATSGLAIATPAATPGGQGLGAGQDVGLDAVMLVGEPLAGPAQAGLDLVEDQQDAPLVAEPADPFEVAGSREVDPPFALDRLDHDGGGLVVERGGQGLQVVVRDVREAGDHRLEAGVILGLGRGREGGVGPAVEAALHRHDLVPARGVADTPWPS